MLKREKVYKCFVQDCLKIFLLVFTSLKMHGDSKKQQCLIEKSKTSYEYCSATVRMAFRIIFILDSTLKCKIVFLKYIKLGFCCNSIATNIKTELEMITCFLRKYWTKDCREIREIK